MGFPLLELPPELRNKVYFHAFAPLSKDSDGFALKFRPRSPTVQGKFVHGIRNAALLRANKQVHVEAAAVLYRHTRFVVPDTWVSAGMFLEALGSAAVARIRHLELAESFVLYIGCLDSHFLEWVGVGRDEAEIEEMRKDFGFERIMRMCDGFVSAWKGVQTVKIRVDMFYHAETQGWAIDLSLFENELLARLPNLQQTALFVRGTPENLRSKCWRQYFRAAKSVGWKINRTYSQVAQKNPRDRLRISHLVEYDFDFEAPNIGREDDVCDLCREPSDSDTDSD